MRGNQPSKLPSSKHQEDRRIFDPNRVACFPLACKDTVLTTHLLACRFVLTPALSQTGQGQHPFFPSPSQRSQHLSETREAGVTSCLRLKGAAPAGALTAPFPGPRGSPGEPAADPGAKLQSRVRGAAGAPEEMLPAPAQPARSAPVLWAVPPAERFLRTAACLRQAAQQRCGTPYSAHLR